MKKRGRGLNVFLFGVIVGLLLGFYLFRPTPTKPKGKPEPRMLDVIKAVRKGVENMTTDTDK